MPSLNINLHAVLTLKIPRIGPDEDPTSALALLVEHGVLIVDAAVSAERIGRIEREFDPWFRAAHCGTGPFLGRKTLRFAGLLAKSSSVADLAIHPLALDLVERVLRGPDPDRPRCDSIELNLTQAVGIQPGEPPQVLHRDDQTWPIPHDIEAMANVMWPLDDFTEENGATMVVPGSHRWDRDRWAKPREIVAATASKGSAIVWLGSLLHGGGANRSTRDSTRAGDELSLGLARQFRAAVALDASGCGLAVARAPSATGRLSAPPAQSGLGRAEIRCFG